MAVLSVHSAAESGGAAVRGAAHHPAARRISPAGLAQVDLPVRAAALPPQSVLGEASEGAVAPEARPCGAPSEEKP